MLQAPDDDPVAAAATVDLDDLFAYDGLDRLTSADRGNLNGSKDAITTLTFAQDYSLDQLNNWSTFQEDSDGNSTLEINQSRTHNDANEVTQIDSASTYVSHDAAGNMTKLPQPDSWSSAYTLTWDAWNRLVKVADGASTVAEYEYDGLNRRIVKRVYASGVHDHDEHFYLSERNQVLEVRKDASTNPLRQYTWGTRYIDDLVLRTRDTDSNGSLDETLYALQDANWNVTALADTSGTVVERFRYDPYGKATVLDASFAADADGESDYAWDYRFTSREWDAETGLHYFRARYYHDGLGRFVGRDPLEYVDGASLYAGYFVPRGVDPMGLERFLRICVDQPGRGRDRDPYEGELGGESFDAGHTFVVVDDTSDRRPPVVAGFHPAGDGGLWLLGAGATTSGTILNDSGRYRNNNYDVYRDYPLTAQQYQDVLDFIDSSRQNPPDYNVWEYNCNNWAIDCAESGGIDVPVTSAPLPDPDGGPPRPPFINCGGLGEDLRNNGGRPNVNARPRR